MKKERKSTENMSGNRTFRHTFRLTEQQNTEMERLMDKAGCTGNKSKYIVGRVLG